MATADLWMPLYIGDYLADTQLLTTEQHGAYMLLIMAYWKNGGPLPDNDEVLQSICKMTPPKWKKARPIIMEFFQVKGGKCRHKRLDEELKRAQQIRQRNQENGAKGGRPQKPKQNPDKNPNQNPNKTQSVSQTEPKQEPKPKHSHSHSHSHLNYPLPGHESSSQLSTLGEVVDPSTGELLVAKGGVE